MTLHEVWDHIMPPDHRRLGLFVFCSLLIHVWAVLFFRMAPMFPPILSTSQPRVTVLGASGSLFSPNPNTSSWLEILDPGMIALPAAGPTREELRFDAMDPQVSSAWPELELPGRLIPTRIAGVGVPDTLEELSTRVRDSMASGAATPMPVKVEAPPQVSGTELYWMGEVGSRPILRKDELPQPRTKISLQATHIRVGINHEGVVEFAMVAQSSGDSEVDRIALRNIRNWRFAPDGATNQIVWDTALILWNLRPPEPESGGGGP